MDPAQKDTAYRLDRIAVPPRPAAMPRSPDAVREALTSLEGTFDRLLAGYHVLDRNYTYDFHNELFLRHTPLLPNYRAAGLQLVAEGRTLAAEAERRAVAARATLADDDPLAALLDDVRAYSTFTVERGPVLERMSASFERTPAGLQHAAHLYEGESKYLSKTLKQIVDKHREVMKASAAQSITSPFASISQSLLEADAHHVVGF